MTFSSWIGVWGNRRTYGPPPGGQPKCGSQLCVHDVAILVGDLGSPITGLRLESTCQLQSVLLTPCPWLTVRLFLTYINPTPALRAASQSAFSLPGILIWRRTHKRYATVQIDSCLEICGLNAGLGGLVLAARLRMGFLRPLSLLGAGACRGLCCSVGRLESRWYRVYCRSVLDVPK